jgi:hypothetical protein
MSLSLLLHDVPIIRLVWQVVSKVSDESALKVTAVVNSEISVTQKTTYCQ